MNLFWHKHPTPIEQVSENDAEIYECPLKQVISIQSVLLQWSVWEESVHDVPSVVSTELKQEPSVVM